MRTSRPAVLGIALILLLAGCSAGDVPSPTEPPVSPSAPPTSMPTAAPTADASGVLPFGGDCANVLSDADAAALLGDLDTPESDAPALVDDLERERSAALAGGLQCAWTASDFSSVVVDVFPANVVPEPLASVGDGVPVCDQAQAWCEGSQRLGEVWINVGSGSETNAVAVLDALRARIDEAGTPSAQTWSSEWWPPLTDCAELREAAAAGLGDPAIEPGFPSDTVPAGPAVDVLGSAGVLVQCSWYGADSGVGVIVFVQPGVGDPDPALVAEEGVVSLDVEGADSAWAVSAESRRPRLLAVAGANRVTVEGMPRTSVETLAAVAAGALAVLPPR